ncbi:MAG: hypothetical protein ACE1ZE_08145 [Candidatus Binatia bacterium]
MHAKTCLSSGKTADGLTPGAYELVREDSIALPCLRVAASAKAGTPLACLL